MNGGAGFLMDLIFPAECLACGTRLARGTVCGECRIGIVPHRTAFCGTCGAALPGLRNICHPGTPYVMGAAGNYGNGTLRSLIHGLKFGHIKGAAAPLADMLAHYFARLPIDHRDFVVVPVPISRERMRERGFNQSALIAERFARFFGMPHEKDLLVRTVHRGPQSELSDRTERRENIRDCYAVRERAGRHSGSGPRKVILIDDVTTSGATFTEAATALRSSGVRKIFALAVAKAM